jgi:hypothetical protein
MLSVVRLLMVISGSCETDVTVATVQAVVVNDVVVEVAVVLV